VHKFLSFASCSLFALAMGCGFVSDDEQRQMELDCQTGGSDCDNDIAADNSSRLALVSAQAPNDLNGVPFVGDFHFGAPGEVVRGPYFTENRRDLYLEWNDPVCVGTSSCEAQVLLNDSWRIPDDTLKGLREDGVVTETEEGKVEAGFKCPNHLFVPKFVSPDSDKAVEVSWNQPGDWGLAPNGTYRDENNSESEYSTTVGQEGVLLLEYGSIIGRIQGQAFSWETEAGSTVEGMISEDLKTITFEWTYANDESSTSTLTLIE